MRPRKGNGTRADDKGDEVHDSSQSLYTGRIRKKRRSREQAADEKILRKNDGGIEGEQGGSSRVGSILHDAYRIVCIDPLGGEMVRQDRSVPVVTGNTFIKE